MRAVALWESEALWEPDDNHVRPVLSYFLDPQKGMASSGKIKSLERALLISSSLRNTGGCNTSE